MVVNVKKSVKQAHKILNIKSCIGIEDLYEILNQSNETFDIVHNSFLIGYLRGHRAAMREIKASGGNK